MESIKKLCNFDQCDRKAVCKGLCRNHYLKKRRSEKPKDPRKKRVFDPKPKCVVDGCEKLHEAKGYCKTHYNKFIWYPKVEALRPLKVVKLKSLKEKKEKIVKFKTIKEKKISTRTPRGTMQSKCDVDDCNEPAVCKTYCSKHYSRWKRHGDTGVNYRNNQKRTKYSINKSELVFTHSHEETMILNEFFEEMGGFGDHLKTMNE